MMPTQKPTLVLRRASESHAERMRGRSERLRRASAAYRPPIVNTILKSAADAHGLPISALLIRCQEPLNVAARRQAMREMFKLGYSLPRIGKYLGGMHHTSVLYHVLALVRPAPQEWETRELADDSGWWSI